MATKKYNDFNAFMKASGYATKKTMDPVRYTAPNGKVIEIPIPQEVPAIIGLMAMKLQRMGLDKAELQDSEEWKVEMYEMTMSMAKALMTEARLNEVLESGIGMFELQALINYISSLYNKEIKQVEDESGN